MKIFTLPSAVTLGKLFLSPLLLPFFLVYLLPFNSLILNILLAALFVMLSLTDLLEGYFAQRFQFATTQSKQLDPIADKLLSCATLIALLAAHKISFYWVIILVGRELFVLGLRLVANEHKFTIAVSFWAKMKTIVSFVYVAFVIVNPYQAAGLSNSWNVIEMGLLLATLGLSLFSAKLYFDQFDDQTGFSNLGNSSVDPIIEEVMPENQQHDHDDLR